MGFQVVWEKVALTPDDMPDDVIVHRGEMLPDWVSPFMLGVLTSTGAVRVVDDAPITHAYAAPAAAESQLPPSYPTGPMPEDAGAVRSPEEPSQGQGEAKSSEETPDQPPATSANKATWVQFAVSKGMNRSQAEALSKEALINRFGD